MNIIEGLILAILVFHLVRWCIEKRQETIQQSHYIPPPPKTRAQLKNTKNNVIAFRRRK